MKNSDNRNQNNKNSENSSIKNLFLYLFLVLCICLTMTLFFYYKFNSGISDELFLVRDIHKLKAYLKEGNFIQKNKNSNKANKSDL